MTKKWLTPLFLLAALFPALASADDSFTAGTVTSATKTLTIPAGYSALIIANGNWYGSNNAFDENIILKLGGITVQTFDIGQLSTNGTGKIFTLVYATSTATTTNIAVSASGGSWGNTRITTFTFPTTITSAATSSSSTTTSSSSSFLNEQELLLMLGLFVFFASIPAWNMLKFTP